MNLILALLAAVIVFCGYLLVDMVFADKRRKASLRARLAPDGSSLGGESYEETPTSLNGDPSPGPRPC